MILLKTTERRGVSDVVAVFGVGLIGGSIVRAFDRSAEDIARLPFSWVDPPLQRAQSARVEAVAGEALAQSPKSRLTYVWSAGRAGFSAEETETARELESFRLVLESFQRVAGGTGGRDPLFVQISSAGALFEGQRFVARDTEPRPVRPYGELKLRQEQLLAASTGSLCRQILRLPSVVGYVRKGQRRGLIPTMIANGLSQRVTEVSGRATTLRDYVWVGDIGRFVHRLITSPERDLTDYPLVLASGRPVSLMRVKEAVERVQKRRIYVRYQASGSNVEDTTFSPALAPRGWRPTDIEVAIRKVHSDTLARGLPPAPT